MNSDKFPNNKNRVWTMCQAALKSCLMCVEEAEKSGLTDEQFYLSWEDCLNKVSCKDHTKQDIEIVEDLKKFNADSK